MPILTTSPSRRMILIVMRPSITMLSPGFRERMSISVSGNGRLGSGYWMPDGILGGVDRNDLLANESAPVNDNRASQIDGRPSLAAHRHDVQNKGVGRLRQLKELDVQIAQVGIVVAQNILG